MVIAKKPENEFEKPPAGVHLARCVRLIDLGTQHNKKFDRDQHKIRIYWELPECLMKHGEYAGKPFIVMRLYTLSLAEKSDLYNDLKSWRGRDFTSQELAGFEMNNILDKCCMLNIVHENDFANIAAIIPLTPGATIPPRINDIVVFDMGNFDQRVFESLSPNLQETIKQSTEYKKFENKMRNENEQQQYQGNNREPFSDDIPF